MSNKLNLHRSNDKWKCGRYNPHPMGISRPLFPPKPISRGQWCQINSMKQSGQLSGAARSVQPLASRAVRPLGRPRPLSPSNQDKTLLRCKELAQASVNSNRQIRSRALESLRGNQDIQELVPGLCSFFVDGVKKCKGDNLSSLFYLLDMANCVNENPSLSIQGHIKDFLSAIGCCLVSKQIPVLSELGDHWKLRDLASRLLGRVCRRYSNGSNELADNLATTLFRYISAENPPLVALYGALAGLTELGPHIVQDSINPNIAYISETIDRVNGSATDIMNAELVRSLLIKIVRPVLKTLENPPKLGSLGAYLQAESFHFPQRFGDGSFVKVGPGSFSSTYSGMSPSNSVNLCHVSQSSHGFVVQGNPTTGATPNMEAGTSTATAAAAGAGGHHAPPSRTGEGASATERIQGDTMPDRRRENTAAIKVSNLSKNAQETDLQELFKPFGHIARIFLAKDKLTGQCNGFAFVNYYKKEDAAKAIASLNGFNYDHLILSVEWTEPPGQIGKKAVSSKQTEGISSNSKRPSPSNILTSGASNNSRGCGDVARGGSVTGVRETVPGIHPLAAIPRPTASAPVHNQLDKSEQVVQQATSSLNNTIVAKPQQVGDGRSRPNEESARISPTITAPSMSDPGLQGEVHVYGVKDWVTEETIRHNFKGSGSILAVYLSKVGYCHIRFSCKEEADRCIADLDEKFIIGRRVKITRAKIAKCNVVSGSHYIYCEQSGLCFNYNVSDNGCGRKRCPRKHVCLFCHQLYGVEEAHRSRYDCPEEREAYVHYPPREDQPQPATSNNNDPIVNSGGDQEESPSSSDRPSKKLKLN